VWNASAAATSGCFEWKKHHRIGTQLFGELGDVPYDIDEEQMDDGVVPSNAALIVPS
jgi:hypothetical protein